MTHSPCHVCQCIHSSVCCVASNNALVMAEVCCDAALVSSSLRVVSTVTTTAR